MTLPRLTELRAYWKQCPPVHHLLAALVGYKASTSIAASAPEATSEQRTRAFELLGMPGTGSVAGGANQYLHLFEGMSGNG